MYVAIFVACTVAFYLIKRFWLKRKILLYKNGEPTVAGMLHSAEALHKIYAESLTFLVGLQNVAVRSFVNTLGDFATAVRVHFEEKKDFDFGVDPYQILDFYQTIARRNDYASSKLSYLLANEFSDLFSTGAFQDAIRKKVDGASISDLSSMITELQVLRRLLSEHVYVDYVDRELEFLKETYNMKIIGQKLEVWDTTKVPAQQCSLKKLNALLQDLYPSTPSRELLAQYIHQKEQGSLSMTDFPFAFQLKV